MSGHGEKRSRHAEAAIAALLACPTIEAAAERVGVAPATLRRWLAEDPFRRRYHEARRRVIEHAVVGLQQAAVDAVGALRRNLTCGTPSAEIAAARTILEQAIKGVELLDLAERIAALEAQLPADATTRR